jgi:hypothetical protein
VMDPAEFEPSTSGSEVRTLTIESKN